MEETPEGSEQVVEVGKMNENMEPQHKDESCSGELEQAVQETHGKPEKNPCRHRSSDPGISKNGVNKLPQESLQPHDTAEEKQPASDECSNILPTGPVDNETMVGSERQPPENDKYFVVSSTESKDLQSLSPPINSQGQETEENHIQLLQVPSSLVTEGSDKVEEKAEADESPNGSDKEPDDFDIDLCADEGGPASEPRPSCNLRLMLLSSLGPVITIYRSTPFKYQNPRGAEAKTDGSGTEDDDDSDGEGEMHATKICNPYRLLPEITLSSSDESLDNTHKVDSPSKDPSTHRISTPLTKSEVFDPTTNCLDQAESNSEKSASFENTNQKWTENDGPSFDEGMERASGPSSLKASGFSDQDKPLEEVNVLPRIKSRPKITTFHPYFPRRPDKPKRSLPSLIPSVVVSPKKAPLSSLPCPRNDTSGESPSKLLNPFGVYSGTRKPKTEEQVSTRLPAVTRGERLEATGKTTESMKLPITKTRIPISVSSKPEAKLTGLLTSKPRPVAKRAEEVQKRPEVSPGRPATNQPLAQNPRPVAGKTKDVPRRPEMISGRPASNDNPGNAAGKIDIVSKRRERTAQKTTATTGGTGTFVREPTSAEQSKVQEGKSTAQHDTDQAQDRSGQLPAVRQQPRECSKRKGRSFNSNRSWRF